MSPSGEFIDMDETLLKDFRYYLGIERRLSSNTVSAYVSDVREFLEKMEGRGIGAASVGASDIVSYLSLKVEQGISKRSEARLLSSLRSFYAWAVEEGEVKSNPCDGVQAPKIGRYLPQVLSVEEVEAIMDSVDTGKKSGLRDRAILEVLYGCGLRVSEAVSLRISDIFFDEGFLRIVGKGNKQRLVPLGDMAADAIRNYLPVRETPYSREFSDRLFLNPSGKPLSRVSMFTMVKRQAMAAGVDKEISPHTFRHSFATHRVENGADLRVVQEMLGHESILTTEIYTHVDSSVWRDTVLSHHPRR